MSDVVEQGGPERPPAPLWVRALVVVAVVGVAAFLLSTGLLSADAPDRSGRSPTPTGSGEGATSSPQPPEQPPVVMRDGNRIVRYDEFGVGVGAELPPDLAETDRLVVDDAPDRPALLSFAAGGRLLRIDMGTDQVTDIGPAHRVIGLPDGGLAVQVADDAAGVVLVDPATGQVVSREPFADAGRPGYQPVGVVSLFGVEGLVLRREAGGGGADELAVTWASGEVSAGRRDAFQPLGRPGRLLGVTDEWVLLLTGRCPGPGCRLVVVGFAGRRSTVRDVRPPEGWSFTPYDGLLRASVVPVVPASDGSAPGATALARLAAGGERALLVEGSAGVLPEAGIVAQEGGVFYVQLGREGIRRVYRWDPAAPGRVTSLGGLPPLPPSARLVCVCE